MPDGLARCPNERQRIDAMVPVKAAVLMGNQNGYVKGIDLLRPDR